MKRLLIPILFIGLLGACASEAPRFASIEERTEAAADSGVCGEPEKGITSELVRDSVTCADSGLVLYLFESRSDLEKWAGVAARIDPTATGANWAASGPAEKVGDLRTALGAEMVTP